jgi:probable F420-dependent oxidoreductase
MSMSIKLGTFLPQHAKYNIGRDVPLVARAAEQAGYDSAWVTERPLWPTPVTQGLFGIPGLAWPEYYRSIADPLVTLSIAAAVTERINVGTSLLVAPYHLASQVARALATLDNASGGRVMAGFGTGWSLDEYAAGSIAPFEKRGAVLDELIEVCAAVWGPDPVSYEGQWTKIAPAEVGPKPAHQIPVLLAATNQTSLRRVAEKADGWMPVMMGAEGLADGWRKLQDLAAASGRTRPIKIAARANTAYSAKAFQGEGRQAFQGNVDQLVEDLAAHAAVLSDAEDLSFIVDLTTTVWDGQQLADVTAELFAAARAAGI